MQRQVAIGILTRTDDIGEFEQWLAGPEVALQAHDPRVFEPVGDLQQVAAARAANEQATARYRSGLGNIDEVAEAQRLLAQAEIDDALARLGVWRALLGIATAAGDLQPFLAEAAQ